MIFVYQQFTKMLPVIARSRLSRFLCTSTKLLYFNSRFHQFYIPQSIIYAAEKLPCYQKQVYRLKYSRKKKQTEEEEEDDDENDLPEATDPFDKHSSIKKYTVTSLRTDLIIKIGMGIARNKVESAFYESRIRVNGKKIFKKSAHVNVGDEIDVIHGPSPSNPDFLVIDRVELMSAVPKEDGVVIQLKRQKKLTIENYDEAWRGSLA